ncbi:ABC transporter permease [Mucilaginibacter sp. AK015]|uniref:ABC transporter permease n=1 Tax=Mucilaginibacter sp. AK015 TaxID=2723072 RepID=UPI0016108A7A|nr:ABC transporter permease [Mucilaginibacter sp. AK015]MBB5394297.1 ABC-type antimicrobial peptide transport system permease subunit [Mucilaginibacter sp. AK015]
MIKNYLKIAWRNLARNKISSLINIGGLAIGMAVSFMLLVYVYNEYSFDKFHVNGDRLYQVFKNQPTNGEIRTKWFTPQLLAGALKKDIPEIANAGRINEPKNVLIAYNSKGLKFNAVAMDAGILNMFSFDFMQGNKRSALSDVSSVILTESAAKAIFGNTNPLGQTVKYNNQFPMKVSAIIKDNPGNSSFTFKAIISWDAFLSQQPWLKGENWDNYGYATYVLLKPNASAAAVNIKIKDLIGRYFPPDKEVKLFMYPFTQLHLHGDFKNGVNVGGRISYLRLFLFLAIGILVIACINFMNLSTARSEKRAREVGIRKAIGARRTALIKQFMGESLLLAFAAFILSLILILVLTPVFADLTGIMLNIPYGNVWVWLTALTATAVTGLFAGSYPALFLSSFNPVRVLKGRFFSTETTVRPRQVLVIIQFTFAICLVVFSFFVHRQINYIKELPIGYNRNGLIELPADGAMFDKFDSFRQEALSAGAITDAASISEPITKITSATWQNRWPGQLPGEEKTPIDCIAVTYHMLNTYQIKIIEGRDFATDRLSDSTAVILNEAAVKLMKLKDPVGQKITWMNAGRTIIGVAKNFVWGSPYDAVRPTIIGFTKGWVGNIGMRLNPSNSVSKNIQLLQDIYKKYNPTYPFDYTFTDESFNQKFKTEQQLGAMAVIFTCLAIIISGLGLFGLASFSAERRGKEISIRKILGAGTAGLWLKLSQEFIKLVLISFVIGAAISWYNVNRWLNTYTYHTNVTIWVFAATLFLSIALCLVAVSWQAIKAALVNPVKSLRSE